MIPKKAAAPRETYAATPDEVVAILEAVANAKVEDKEITPEQRLKAQAALALQFLLVYALAKRAAPVGKISTAGA